MQTGKFITLEGGEGVGKTTNLQVIERCLQQAGIDFIKTREPGGTPLAEQLRELLLVKRDESVDPTAELLMVFAARAQHLNTLIKPALARGQWVLCDRFTDATYAYQGAGRGLPLATIAALEQLVQPDLQPDLTLLLDVDVGVGMARAQSRSAADRFESEVGSFFERVRAMYLQRAAQQTGRFRIIDAAQAMPQVAGDIECVLRDFIAESGRG